jgi:hypothetical protein
MRRRGSEEKNTGFRDLIRVEVGGQQGTRVLKDVLMTSDESQFRLEHPI